MDFVSQKMVLTTARTLVATNRGNRWFFLYGFEKNDRANITNDELEALKEIAEQLLARAGSGKGWFVTGDLP